MKKDFSAYKNRFLHNNPLADQRFDDYDNRNSEERFFSQCCAGQ